MAPKNPSRTEKDAQFDFADKLPAGVPPLEQPLTPGSSRPNGPASATFYFPVSLDKCSPTGVFFPAGYSFPATMNVILYFHGHKQGKFTNIDRYWNGSVHNVKLREDINATGKSAVLIAPTMGENPGSGINSDMGIFGKPRGGDDFLDEVRTWIRKYVPQYSSANVTPDIGNVVLAGHSGAGGILSLQSRTMGANICEVWGFDSMYGEGYELDKNKKKVAIDVTGNWENTATAHASWSIEFEDRWGLIPFPRYKPRTQFYFYWADDSPGNNSRKLQEKVRQAGLSNVFIEANAQTGVAHHFETITTHFKKRVAAADCF